MEGREGGRKTSVAELPGSCLKCKFSMRFSRPMTSDRIDNNDNEVTA